MIGKKTSADILNERISKEKKIVKEMISLLHNLKRTENKEEKNMIFSHMRALKISLQKTNESVLKELGKVFLTKPLNLNVQEKKVEPQQLNEPAFKLNETVVQDTKIKPAEIKLSKLEKDVLKRLKEKEEEEIVEKKIKKPSKYVKTANKMFANISRTLIKKKMFPQLEKDLRKANLKFIPISYVSLILFTTLLSVIFGGLVFGFFLFFNFGVKLPIITLVEGGIGSRFLKIFWILFAIPIGTFLITYVYPSLEKKSAEWKINQELPFATIHMSAISGSMIDPSKIFSIIISTKEYPYLEKEFTKLMNEINIYGYNLVNALRSVATNSPSKKLSELLNGLATTITSGGDLSEFFDKRAQSLLFEHKIEREKQTKSAETIMDVYISVVIAAPMMLMLLLMMMKISGLGISLPTSTITIIMVLGVSMINIIFLTFLQLKRQS